MIFTSLGELHKFPKCVHLKGVTRVYHDSEDTT